MVQSTESFELRDKKPGFWKPFLIKGGRHFEDVSVAKTIPWCLTINWKIILFRCFKNYGSPTRVTRLKISPNIPGPISLEDSDRFLKISSDYIYNKIFNNVISKSNM